MNRIKKRNLKFALLGIVVLVVVVMFFPSDSLADDDSMSFTIPVPQELNFAGQTALNSNDSITCRVKQTTHAIDSTGITREQVQSKLLEGNPLLSVTTVSGIKMAGYVVEPKIFCSNNFSTSGLSNPDRFTFVIDPSSLLLQVSARDKDGITKVSYNTSFNTKSASIPIGGTEKSLGTVGVYASQVEANLQDGSYSTTTKFDLRGNLVVYWQGYAGQKYKIPVNNGDIVSYHNAKIEKGSTGTSTFTGDDKDGDGIKDAYDKCPTQPENYNGYQDSDGCPDVSPTTTTTTTSSTSPVIYAECIPTGKTWYFDSNSKTTSYCGVKYNTVSGACGFYDIATKQCITLASKISLPSGDVTLSNGVIVKAGSSEFLSGGVCYQKDMDICVYNKEKLCTDVNVCSMSSTTTTQLSGLTGKVIWTGTVKYKDATTGTFSTISDTPFSFSFPLASLVGSSSGGTAKEISEFTLNPVLKFDNADIHKQFTTEQSKITYLVTMNVKGNWIVITPDTPLPDFKPSSGSTYPSGISLGNIVIRVNELDAKIPSTTVGINDSSDAKITVDLSGTLDVNQDTGTAIKPLTINFSIVTEKTGSTTFLSTGDTRFTWSDLKFIRGTGSSGVGGIDIPDADKCAVGNVGYMLNDVLICQPKGIVPTDNNNDGIIDESSGGLCAGLTPQQCLDQGKTNTGENGVNTSSGGMCPLDSGIGDSNGDGKICQICTDNAPNSGGFPCDEGYRENYCNSTTQCSVPEVGDNLKGGAVVVDDPIKGGSTGGVDSCTGASCIIQKNTNPFVSGGSSNYLSDPNLIWYLAGGILIIAIIAVVAKKKK